LYPYIPNTENEINEMLSKIGVSKKEDLFESIPDELIIDGFNLEKSKSEIEVSEILNNIAKKNKTIDELTCFLGAGSYDHYIPSVCSHITSRPEFFTAYTPYQPEISQGTLQAIFEYQSMMCMLTEMEVSNISMYDVSTALTEACNMAVESTRRRKILVSKAVNPQSRRVLKTYAHFRNIEIIEVAETEGTADYEKIKSSIDNTIAAVVVQTPNFFGIIEDISEIEKITHNNKSLLILSVDPLSLGILKTPYKWGADIVVGDCQCFGNKLNFGGPYLGFLNTTKKLLRKMPGRIVGETIDTEGKRGFVLTHQTREQHIRREKATSNICSDQTLVAINAAVYLTTLGKKGVKEVAEQCLYKSNYAFKKLIGKKGISKVYNKPFFKEFVVKTDIDYNVVSGRLMDNNILCGYDLSKDYENHKNNILFCVTEKRTKQEIDNLSKVLGEILENPEVCHDK